MHGRKAAVVAIVSLAAVLVLSGCRSAQDMKAPGVPLSGTTWLIETLNGEPYKAIEGLRRPTIEFNTATGQFKAVGGINNLAGSCAVEGQALRFGPSMGTMMAGPPEAMAFEDAFRVALESATRWQIEGSRLVLSDGEREVLIFSAGEGAR